MYINIKVASYKYIILINIIIYLVIEVQSTLDLLNIHLYTVTDHRGILFVDDAYITLYIILIKAYTRYKKIAELGWYSIYKFSC